MKLLSLTVASLTMAASMAVSLRGISPDSAAASGNQVLLGVHDSPEVMTKLHQLSHRREGLRNSRVFNDQVGSKDGSLAGRLVISHADLGYMNEATVDEEADLIEKTFVDAYNKAHPDGDFQMTSMTLLKESLVPEDIPSFLSLSEELEDFQQLPSETFTYVAWTYRFGYHCALCPHAPVSSDMLHISNRRDFEESFCEALKQSSLKAFQSSTNCSVVFSQHDNDALILNEERLDVYRRRHRKPNADDEDADGQGFLVMEYVDLDKREDLAQEVAKVEAAFVAAYNDAHPGNDFEMVSMTMTDESEIPVPDMLNALTYPNYWVNNVWWRYNFGYHCRLCREDDMWDYPPRLDAAVDALDMDSPALKSAHRDFETIFCQILKESKLGEFTNVDNCSIFFEYNKNGKGKGKKGNPPVLAINE